jgi:hypothetical protein
VRNERVTASKKTIFESEHLSPAQYAAPERSHYVCSSQGYRVSCYAPSKSLACIESPSRKLLDRVT